MTWESFAWLFGVALLLVALAAAGFGLRLFFHNRKPMRGCACEFDADRLRDRTSVEGCRECQRSRPLP